MNCLLVTEKAPEMTAWLAMIVARVARMMRGMRAISGASRKKGFLIACIAESGSSDRIMAPWPM